MKALLLLLSLLTLAAAAPDPAGAGAGEAPFHRPFDSWSCATCHTADPPSPAATITGARSCRWHRRQPGALQ